MLFSSFDWLGLVVSSPPYSLVHLSVRSLLEEGDSNHNRVERNSLKERYIQGSLFLFEVCYVKSEKKRIINATWQKTGQGEVYSPEVRKGLKQLNIPSRIGYDKGYRTRVYSTSTIDDFDEDKYNQIKIVLEEVLDFFDKMSGRDLMSFINEQYLTENLTTGKKIRMPP